MSTVIEHHMVVIKELLVGFVLCALEIVYTTSKMSDNLKVQWYNEIKSYFIECFNKITIIFINEWFLSAKTVQ